MVELDFRRDALGKIPGALLCVVVSSNDSHVYVHEGFVHCPPKEVRVTPCMSPSTHPPMHYMYTLTQWYPYPMI
jgi:hypothetical protein